MTELYLKEWTYKVQTQFVVLNFCQTRKCMAILQYFIKIVINIFCYLNPTLVQHELACFPRAYVLLCISVLHTKNIKFWLFSDSKMPVKDIYTNISF